MTNAFLILVTAYCHCATCCGEAGERTASGLWPRPGITAAGPRSLPFGTRLQIPGVGRRLVQDRLARRYDNRIDIFVATHREARQFGARYLKVHYEP